MWQPHTPDHTNLLVATSEENKDLVEISCFVTAKLRTKPVSTTYDNVKKNMVGHLLSASFYLITLLIFRLWGKAGMEVSPGVGLEQDWGTHSPSARFRLQFQIVQPAAVWGLGSFGRVYYWKLSKCIWIQGPPKVRRRLIQPPKNTVCSPPSLRWGRNSYLVNPGSLQHGSNRRGGAGKQLLIQPGGTAAVSPDYMRWTDFNSAVQPCTPSAETCLPDYTGKVNFTPNLRGRIEAHEKNIWREQGHRLLGTACFVPGWSIQIWPLSKFVEE